MPALKHPVRYRLEYALARAAFAVLGLLPIGAASAFGSWLGRTIGPLTRAHDHAVRNLARALPGLSAGQQGQVLRDVWDNFGRTMVEYAVLAKLGKRENAARITVRGHEALPTDKPALLFCAHLGNWEVIPIALGRHGKAPTIVYRPANNPLVDDLIARVRAPFAAGMAPKGASGARQVMKTLGDGGQVIMVVDQKLNTGVEVPFFGRGAFTAPALARFAQRFQCPIFPVRTERLAGGSFAVTVEEPWAPPGEGEAAERALLGRMNRRLEDWISAKPGQWLWLHRRWPD